MSDVKKPSLPNSTLDSDETKDLIEQVTGHAALFRPIDPEVEPVVHCPFCGFNTVKASDEEEKHLGEYKCSQCNTPFDVRTGISGERNMRSFILLTPDGPKCVIGPQHLEHMLETDSLEIPAAGWFGDASVGLGHALRLGTMPRLDLDDLGIVLEDMDVIIITSSVWHHKQYAKTSGYFLHYHPDALFSEMRRADIFMATKMGLLLDSSEKQKNAVITAYLERDWDTVKTASRMASHAVGTWGAGDEASVPEYEEEEDWWIFDHWKLILSFIFFVVVLVIALKVWGII